MNLEVGVLCHVSLIIANKNKTNLINYVVCIMLM